MKYVSLFSGIEAATVAWEPLGWEPVCFAEFDAVYLCDGWENARGCKVERAAAVAYDLELIGYDLPCRGDAS